MFKRKLYPIPNVKQNFVAVYLIVYCVLMIKIHLLMGNIFLFLFGFIICLLTYDAGFYGLIIKIICGVSHPQICQCSVGQNLCYAMCRWLL